MATPAAGEVVRQASHPAMVTGAAHAAGGAPPPPLPLLPVPRLEETCAKYLKVVQALLPPTDFEATQLATEAFLRGPGPALQAKLDAWTPSGPDDESYIERNWFDA